MNFLQISSLFHFLPDFAAMGAPMDARLARELEGRNGKPEQPEADSWKLDVDWPEPKLDKREYMNDIE